jgi:hypothetical protein
MRSIRSTPLVRSTSTPCSSRPANAEVAVAAALGSAAQTTSRISASTRMALIVLTPNAPRVSAPV